MKNPAEATENPHPLTPYWQQALQTVASSNTRNPTNHRIPRKAGCGRNHVSQKDISVLGDLRASLLARVLNEFSDEEGKHKAEDQCLTAVLGTIHQGGHRNELSHATRLELANIETGIHEENSQASSNLNLRSVIIKVREVQHSNSKWTEPKEGNIQYSSSPAHCCRSY